MQAVRWARDIIVTFPRHRLRLRALAAMVGEAETLIEVQAELAELENRRRNLVAKRGRLVRSLIEARGWKFVARTLGVGHSRVYAMSAKRRES